MSYEIAPDRRRFFKAAALALASTQFDVTTDARAQNTTKAPRKTAMNSNTSFAPFKQINAGLLNVGYAEAGPAEAGRLPLPPKAELQWWYQFYFATDRGRAGYDKYRHDFAKLL